MSYSRIPSTIPTISSEKLIKSLSLQARWHVCIYTYIYISKCYYLYWALKNSKKMNQARYNPSMKPANLLNTKETENRSFVLFPLSISLYIYFNR